MAVEHTFPAVFRKEKGGYSVVFPDLDIATSGESFVEAMLMAKDALGMYLQYLTETNSSIPNPSDIAALGYPEDASVYMVKCNTEQ